MNITELKKTDYIMFEAVVGSHAYGTNTETSDIDVRGIFCYPSKLKLNLEKLPSEIGQEHPEDIKFYELEKYIHLIKDCNPNVIEYLYTPKDCIRYCDERMKYLIENRREFITARAYHTFGGYAFAQIKKMRGQNKWINNEQPKEPPKIEDFCYIIYGSSEHGLGFGIESIGPCRPVLLKDSGYKISDFDNYGVSSLEHVPNVFRLYAKGDGVFKGGQIVCSSIPLENEWKEFFGLLVFNQIEYEKAKINHKQYWEWMENRNPHRWIMQEEGKIDYDVKNAQHCIRLLMCCQSIFETGEPTIRFEGDQLDYLRKIREGKFSYDHIIKDVEGRMNIIETLYEENKLKLPYSPNYNKVNEIYKNIVNWKGNSK